MTAYEPIENFEVYSNLLQQNGFSSLDKLELLSQRNEQFSRQFQTPNNNRHIFYLIPQDIQFRFKQSFLDEVTKFKLMQVPTSAQSIWCPNNQISYTLKWDRKNETPIFQIYDIDLTKTNPKEQITHKKTIQGKTERLYILKSPGIFIPNTKNSKYQQLEELLI